MADCKILYAGQNFESAIEKQIVGMHGYIVIKMALSGNAGGTCWCRCFGLQSLISAPNFDGKGGPSLTND